jgi:hypothetical protein
MMQRKLEKICTYMIASDKRELNLEINHAKFFSPSKSDAKTLTIHKLVRMLAQINILEEWLLNLINKLWFLIVSSVESQYRTPKVC